MKKLGVAVQLWRRRRRPTLILIFFASTALASLTPTARAETEPSRLQKQAQRVRIVRDDWGVAHVYGTTDADAVFGSLYAQAEDDFFRVETNYINAMGRLAETEGESKVYQDLRMKLFIEPAKLQAQYAASPEWLKALMNAFADGLNYYLLGHAEVKPRVIRHFEPWMALSFTEGSIGGDIEHIDLSNLQAFYGRDHATGHIRKTAALHAVKDEEREPSGSNGIAIAPSHTVAHHALLLINPHTSFFFRSELQMVSQQGLDAYGASTWGQFFIYQGFNDRAGWMHTSSGVDAVDEYLETVEKKADGWRYRYGNQEKPLIAEQVTVPYKTPSGMAQKIFTVFRTQHGPIIREEGGKWISIRMMQEPVKALSQSYLRTKARSYREYRQTMDLQANSSNNTIFADGDGDIAYFHGNFIPRRNVHFDWTKPVDGANPATEWQGLLSVDETPHLLNPTNGWLFNVNNWPWSAAGKDSPRKSDYPAYVESGTESARGLHAIRVLQGRKDFTLDRLLAAAYDSYLTWFDKPMPALLAAWDALPAADPMKPKLAKQIEALRTWDHRWSVSSVATSLAVFWGEDLRKRFPAAAKRKGQSLEEYASDLPASDLLTSLEAASARLSTDFGSWRTPWGKINRFQRLTGDIAPQFSDSGASIPVGFTSSTWGSLASFGAQPASGTKKWYGTSGNSFVAVVEFGQRVRAKAVTAGGESGHPSSRHFNDQAQRYSTGALRDVYFYPDELKGHVEREYHPGD